MRAPLIGLVGRRKYGRNVVGFPEPLADQPVDLYFSFYAMGVSEAGGLPVHLPMHLDPADIVDRLDGLVLTGGADIDPGRYGHEPETDEFPPETDRDALELGLLDAAAEASLPTLGICRGHQMLNVWAGGTLHQDVPPHGRFDLDPATEIHTVSFTDGSLARELYGAERPVNSLHHQTVDAVGDRIRVTGTSPDGTVEALEFDGLPWFGVQWHPEMMNGRSSDPAFRWIVDTSRSG